jgi:hypothetical protein
MREELEKVRAAQRIMEKSGVFKKTLAAEDVLQAALVLIEKMVDEIEQLKAGRNDGMSHP